MKIHPILAGATAIAIVAAAGAAQAQLAIPYADSGNYNPITYTFTAAASGDIVAYFATADNTASFDNNLGLLVDGTAQGGFGLDNHTSVIGQSYDFGFVSAGSTLVFVLNNMTLGEQAFSDPTMNLGYDIGPATGTADGHNHVYSTFFNGINPGGDAAAIEAAGVPHGTYVAFEDEPFPDSDYNYHDEEFVFTDVATSVPEPAAWSLMLLGVGGIGGFMRRKSRQLAAAA